MRLNWIYDKAFKLSKCRQCKKMLLDMFNFPLKFIE